MNLSAKKEHSVLHLKQKQIMFQLRKNNLFILLTVSFISCNSYHSTERFILQCEQEYKLENYEHVIEMCNSYLNNDTNSIAFLYRGKSYLKLKNYEKSLMDFSHLYTSGDTSTEILVGLGHSNAFVGNAQIAYKIFHKLVGRHSDSLQYSYFLALICQDLNRELEAITHLKSALVGNETNLVYLYELAITYQNIDSFQKSIIYFNKVIDGFGEKCSDTLFYNRAVSYSHLGPIDSCLRDISIAILINPFKADYYYYRAVIYMHLKNKYECCENFKSAILRGYLASKDDEIRKYCNSPN